MHLTRTVEKPPWVRDQLIGRRGAGAGGNDGVPVHPPMLVREHKLARLDMLCMTHTSHRLFISRNTQIRFSLLKPESGQCPSAIPHWCHSLLLLTSVSLRQVPHSSLALLWASQRCVLFVCPSPVGAWKLL